MRRFDYRDCSLGRLWLEKRRADANRQPSVRKETSIGSVGVGHLPWIRERVESGELSLIPILVGSTSDVDLGWLADRQMMPGKPAPLIEFTESTAKWQAVRLAPIL